MCPERTVISREECRVRILIINCVCGIRSTGRICTELAEQFMAEGNEVRIAYGRMEEVPEEYQKLAVRIGTKKDLIFHVLRTRLFDQHGFGSVRATRRFLQWAEEYKPDLVWLHNIHGYYINVEMLFSWIKTHPEMLVRWTLHDCWAFTGHCAYFTAAKCEQWKDHCLHCIQRKEYPSCYGWGSVERNYDRKKAAFTGVSHMTLITPSQWLADLVRQSFLKEYPVEVHYNTINTDVFKPTPGNFRARYQLQDKIIVLGVASTWDDRKGLKDFLQLAKMLDKRFTIVLVGLNPKQLKSLPTNIKGIGRTNDARELAELYTTADVFVNPTYEDNYPTVNLEAAACGTKVITYDTGGCRETIQDTQGVVVGTGCLEDLYREILKSAT